MSKRIKRIKERNPSKRSKLSLESNVEGDGSGLNDNEPPGTSNEPNLQFTIFDSTTKEPIRTLNSEDEPHYQGNAETVNSYFDLIPIFYKQKI